MSVEITWLGHNTWEIVAEGHRILLDPFLDDSPTATKKAADVKADHILVSHGHFDHIADCVKIAKRTSATVVTNFEICTWLQNQDIAEDHTVAMNSGGGIDLPFGRVTLTMAHHSSGLPDGSYGGTAGGFHIAFTGGKKAYFACDTSLFLDMKLIGMGGLDLAVLPIGDLFTMGPADSIEAIKLLSPKKVAPCHYNTWPPIAQDANAWAENVKRQTAADPLVLSPGQSILL